MRSPCIVAILLILMLPLSAAFPVVPSKRDNPVFSPNQQLASENPFLRIFPISKSPSPFVLYPSNDSVWIAAIATGSTSVSSQILQFFLNGTLRKPVPVLTNLIVSSIVVDPIYGRAWFPENNTLAYYDPHIGQLGNATTFADKSPQYIALDSSNRLWLSLVGSQGRSSIAMYNPKFPQEKPTIYPVPAPNATVQGIAVAPDESIWFAETGAKKLARLDPSTSNTTEYSSPLTLIAPIQIAVDNSGIVWFTDHGDNEFGWFNPKTNAWRTLPIGYCQYNCAYGLPNAIFVNNGEIWFSEHIAGRIGRYNPNSGLLTEYVISSSSSPLAWWAEPGPNNLVWFTALGLGEIGYVNASIPVPLSINGVLADVVVQRGGYQRVPVIVSSTGPRSFSLNSSATTQDYSGFYTPQVYSSSQSEISSSKPYSTSIVVFAAWNATIGPRNVALTAFNGQVNVNAFVRVNVVDSSTPYVTVGFASVITFGNLVLYARRPRKPGAKPVRRVRK
jgi:streptogramin lyase